MKNKFIKYLAGASLVLALGSSVSVDHVFADDQNTSDNSDTDTQRKVSIQNLYAVAIDAKTGKVIQRSLIATEHGYTDSPARNFSIDSYPQINGYKINGNPSKSISVDWDNPSGVTTIKVYYTPEGSQAAANSSANTTQTNNNQVQKQTKQANKQDLYHLYRAYIGKPIGPDKALTAKEKAALSPATKKKLAQFGDLDANSNDQGQPNKTNKKKKKAKTKLKVKKAATKGQLNPTTIVSSAVGILVAAALIVYGALHLKK
ncbi:MULTISPECIES: hypothetical protein [Lactobacillus]|uniref:MucBP domain-containing protein n=1 Tax=Lactobacillus xujianguonis TaxID=2495899 RepID=A0A437SST3_9LACO|nr:MULTISPECIES: hypothetical protein [Lactobacillus]RVU69968.1 hypothetical protein EJK17_10105 [Lactobacillus xujianguonis]RVU72374.1 hypothetical protein EJK20_10205 [Lactobacillus xujianguonis]